MKVKVLQYCPKVKDCVELTLKDVTETELTFKGKVVACNRQDKCHAMFNGSFCWINHTIETSKIGAEKIEC